MIERGISSRTVLEERLRDEPKEHVCKINCFFFFSKGLNCEKNCDTVAVHLMLKQKISFLASYVIVIWMLQKKPFK